MRVKASKTKQAKSAPGRPRKKRHTNRSLQIYLEESDLELIDELCGRDTRSQWGRERILEILDAERTKRQKR